MHVFKSFLTVYIRDSDNKVVVAVGVWCHRLVLSSSLPRIKLGPSEINGNFTCDFDRTRMSLIGLMARRDNYNNLSRPFE